MSDEPAVVDPLLHRRHITDERRRALSNLRERRGKFRYILFAGDKVLMADTPIYVMNTIFYAKPEKVG